MHDPRLGRFFAVDPLASKYPYNSPYAFSENMVIHMVELEGLEATYTKTESGGKTHIKIVLNIEVVNSVVTKRIYNEETNSFTTEYMSQEEIEKRTNQIRQQILYTYAVEDEENNVVYSAEVNFIYLDYKPVFKDHYYIEFVNVAFDPEISMYARGLTFEDRFDENNLDAPIYGGTVFNRMEVSTYGGVYHDNLNVQNSITEVGWSGAHEVGHSLGLLHEKSDLEPRGMDLPAGNLMINGGLPNGWSKLEPEQMRKIVKSIDEDAKILKKHLMRKEKSRRREQKCIESKNRRNGK